MNVAEDARVARLSSYSQASVIVLGTRLADGEPCVAVVEKLRARVPHTPIVVVTDDLIELASWAPKLARSGVDQAFCVTSTSDWATLELTLSRHLSAPHAELPIRCISEGLSENPERTLALHFLRN